MSLTSAYSKQTHKIATNIKHESEQHHWKLQWKRIAHKEHKNALTKQREIIGQRHTKHISPCQTAKTYWNTIHNNNFQTSLAEVVQTKSHSIKSKSTLEKQAKQKPKTNKYVQTYGKHKQQTNNKEFQTSLQMAPLSQSSLKIFVPFCFICFSHVFFCFLVWLFHLAYWRGFPEPLA